MLYHNPSSIDGIENHIVKINYKGGGELGEFKLAGVMNNKEIEIPFGTSLTNEGDVKGVGGAIDHLSKNLGSLGNFLVESGNSKAMGRGRKLGAIGSFIDTVKSVVDSGVGAVSDVVGVDLKKRTALYSVVRPDSWSKPSISFTCTFYRGMTMGGYTTPNFSEFASALAKAMLPSQSNWLVTSLLESNQLSIAEALKLITEGMSLNLGDDTSTTGKNDLGFGVEIGKFMSIPNGLWLTNAPITAPTVFDSKGQPVYWDVKFEFEYYRMPTYLDMQSWLKVNNKEASDSAQDGNS